MKVSTISHEVAFPANVNVVAARSESGKPAQTIQGQENSETTTHEGLALEVKPPIEMVINGQGLGLKFFYDRDAGIRVIQVVDEESGDVVRQIPPDEVVDFMRQFRETKGNFVSLRF
ncbi:MAG: flagellar protein FlaG [Candidatus Binatia bacterium]